MDIKYLSTLLVSTTIMITSCMPQATEKNVAETKTVSTTSTSVPTKTSTDKWAEYRGSVVEFNARIIKKYGSEQSTLEDILKSGNVIIDFYADWCGPCKRMAPNFSEAAKNAKNTLFVKINVDTYKNIAKKYGIKNLPTLVYFKNGAAVKTVTGFKNVPELTALARS